MAKFSEGFLSSLRNAGQRGSVTDPALMGQDRAPQYGSSNPLTRSVGGLLGMDMRTNPEVVKDEMSAIAAPVGSPEHLRETLLVRARHAPVQEQTLLLAKVAEMDQAKAAERARVAKEQAQVSSFAKFAEKKYPELKPLIESGVVTGANINKFVSASTDTGKANSYSYNDSGKVTDSKGNIFNRIVRRVNSGPDAGKIDVVLAGADGAPESPIGKITPVGGQFDQTPQQQAALKGDIEAEKGWGKTLTSAVEILPKARESRSSAQKALTLAQQFETGGFTAELKQSATDFFGITPTNEGEFAVLVQDMMVSKLGEAIKGNPTAREMDEIKKTMAAVGKGKGLNIRILSSAVDQLDRLISRSEYLMSPDANKEGYAKFIAAQYEPKDDAEDKNTASAIDRYLKEAQDRAASRGVR